jgi:hypothetical protein
MPNPRPRKYPKVSTENLIRSSRDDFGVPTPLNQAIGRRFSEQEQADRKAADMKMSPLDRLKARLEAGAVIGSGIFESVQQLPKLLQGEDSYNEAIAKRMYEPRSNPEKSYEYVGDVADFLEKLETEYKIPQLIPQLVAYQSLISPATQQAKKAVERGAVKAGMALERSLEKPVTDIMNRGGVGADLLGSVNTNPSRIVKSGGGNWLRQGLDDQRTLGDAGRGKAQSKWESQPEDFKAQYPEREQLAVASDTVADWANNNMRKYMANQMGTDKDPVRLLAEQDISHFGMRPDEFGEFPYIKPSDQTKKLRRKHTERTGEESPVGESSLAAYWENLSDNAIKATTVGDIKNAPNAYYSLKAKEDIAPYVDKVPPETPIYNIDNESRGTQSVREQLGFNRLLGVMRDDIAAGRITPEEVSKWDMEQAVRHVDKRDKAIYKAEAEEADRLAKEFAKYFPTLKEYPDKSRWIELKVPDLNDLPKEERLQLIDKLKKEAREQGIDPEQYVEDYPRMKLEEALKHEGEKMGHCVGSYCEDVVTGKSRVISYRDANGDSHVTLEITPNENPYGATGSGFVDLPIKTRTEYENIIRQWRRNNPDVEYLTDADINRALKESGVEPRPDEIMQIKGKGDAAPVGRYQPYVQDFQRMTKYPIEGDFANSGFDFPATGPRGIFDEDQVKTLREAGHEVHDYLTKAEREDLVRKLYEKETGNDMDTGNPLNPPKPPEPPVEGMKAGGAVHMSDNPDTMRMELQNQRYAGGGIVRGLKQASKVAAKNADKAATKSAVKVANEPSITKAPSIIIPSKLSDVKEAIRQSKGNYGAKRVERAADEIPNLERLYKEEALKQAFGGDNAKPLMTMNPADFEKYAMGLRTRTITEPKSFGDKTRMSTEDYLKYLRTLPEGFDDVPFLEINKQEQGLPLMPFISGHEGRHRNRAMAESGEESGLVRLFPRAELREGFPRKSQEEYIEALKKELEMTGNLVLPEHNRYNPADVQRPAIDMPDIYAEGGKVHVSDSFDAMQMELDNKKFAMGGAVGENDVGSPSPQNSASPVPNFQAGGVVKKAAAKAAKAVKPSLVIKSQPSLIVSNLIDEEPNIAKRLGAEARAKRQKAIEAEGKRQEAAKQTQPSVGYRQSTPQKPDPLVGTRFVNEPAFGLNPNDPFDITKYKGGSGMVLPWDSQSRNVKTTQVSDVDLPNQIFDVTHGGIPYAFDTQHVAKGVAGASGEEISKRIKTRSDIAVQANKDQGGTGELLHFPITMGYRAEDYALPYSEFSFDIINHKLMTGELTKREADELSEMVKNFTPPGKKYKGKKPFAEFAGFTEPEGLNQIYTGEGLKVPSGELRKAIADRIIWQKGSQEKLGFNAEDLMNATTYEPLRGVDKGFIGSTVMRNTPTGMRLSPSAGKYPYDTDFSGEHLGRLDDIVDTEALFYRTLNPIKHELMARENLKPYNKESLRNSAIAAIEKRNEGVSQPIDQQFLDDYNDYITELKKPHEYKEGGAISALMKHAETAGQSARMNNQRM